LAFLAETLRQNARHPCRLSGQNGRRMKITPLSSDCFAKKTVRKDLKLKGIRERKKQTNKHANKNKVWNK
jgi:hypothetical protein